MLRFCHPSICRSSVAMRKYLQMSGYSYRREAELMSAAYQRHVAAMSLRCADARYAARHAYQRRVSGGVAATSYARPRRRLTPPIFTPHCRQQRQRERDADSSMALAVTERIWRMFNDVTRRL